MSQTPQDYYELLGVARDATPDDIKRAYRRLARQFHPDVNSEAGAEERFKEISNAYQVLNDPEKRRVYDRFGHAGLGGAGGFGGFNDFSGFGGLDDIIDELFGRFTGGTGTRRRSQRRGPQPGRDLIYELTITFEEAVRGVEKEIEITRQEVCPDCNGSGAEPGSTPQRCPECNGTGEIRTVRQHLFGSMINVTACPTCSGRGEIITEPCKTCRGSTRVNETRQLKISVPAGVENGNKIRIYGEGEPGLYGGPQGNLYVTIRVQPHKFFRREGNDILLDIAINVAQAALGDTVAVPTIDGEWELEIPAGTQTGESFRIRSKGFPHLRRDGTASGRGDQIVFVQVAIPRHLTPEQRALFEELATTLDTDILPPQNKGFFARMKDFFSGEG